MNTGNSFPGHKILLKPTTHKLIHSNQKHLPQATVRLYFIPNVIERDCTGWGKSIFTVVLIENNTIINR